MVVVKVAFGREACEVLVQKFSFWISLLNRKKTSMPIRSKSSRRAQMSRTMWLEGSCPSAMKANMAGFSIPSRCP